MRTLGFLFIAVAAVVSPAKASEIVTVRNNPGGYQDEFDAQAKEWAKTGTKVRIAGSCASACTMYVMTKYRLDVCASPGATLKFHMPYFDIASGGNYAKDMSAGAVQDSKKEWSRNWLGHFNPKLNAVLAKATRNGVIPNPSTEAQGSEGVASRFYTVKAMDFIPTCD